MKTDYSQNEQDGAIDGDSEEPVKVLEKQATFNEFVVWGHEVLPAADDPFVKGVEEWLKFAEAVCSVSSLVSLWCWADLDIIRCIRAHRLRLRMANQAHPLNRRLHEGVIKFVCAHNEIHNEALRR